MAKGKFFNGKVKKDRSKYIKIGVIAGGALLLVLLVIVIFKFTQNNDQKEVEIHLKETVNIEINSKPDVMDYINKLENFDKKKIIIEDYDISKVGTYKVKITAKGVDSATITVNVVDTTAPTLKTKDVKINVGETYKVEDFVKECKDNSKGNCIVEYFNQDIDEKGNAIDYSKFTKEGTYVIKLTAKDDTGNSTAQQEAKLTISKKDAETPEIPSEEDPEVNPDPKPETPVSCTYGDLTYDTNFYNYPIAVIVGDKNKGCAINMNLWNDDKITENVNSIFNVDYKKLQNDLNPILQKEFPYGATIEPKVQYLPIINKDGNGLIGFGIHIKVYMKPNNTQERVDQDKYLKLEYYLKDDYSRDYKVNKYNLK